MRPSQWKCALDVRFAARVARKGPPMLLFPPSASADSYHERRSKSNTSRSVESFPESTQRTKSKAPALDAGLAAPPAPAPASAFETLAFGEASGDDAAEVLGVSELNVDWWKRHCRRSAANYSLEAWEGGSQRREPEKGGGGAKEARSRECGRFATRSERAARRTRATRRGARRNETNDAP